MTSTMTLPVYALAGLVPFMATKDTRYYLNGLMVEPTRAVATDGHALAVAHSGGMEWSGPAQRVILPSEMVKAVVRQSKPGGLIRLTIPEAGPLVAQVEEVRPGMAAVVHGDRIDGRYPDAQAVIPLEVSGDAAAIGGDVLGKVTEAAKALVKAGAGRYVAVRIDQNGQRAAGFRLTCSGAPELSIGGVLMPLRDNGKARVAASHGDTLADLWGAA